MLAAKALQPYSPIVLYAALGAAIGLPSIKEQPMPRAYIGQNFPNYQEQRPGPEPGLGLTPPRHGQFARPRLTAPMSINNQAFPQQHIYAYRLEPSGAGPGGQDIHLPEEPAPMSLLQRLKLFCNPPPDGSRLPIAPWRMVQDTARLWGRLVTGEDQG
jgi:hypothetical protein